MSSSRQCYTFSPYHCILMLSSGSKLVLYTVDIVMHYIFLVVYIFVSPAWNVSLSQPHVLYDCTLVLNQFVSWYNIKCLAVHLLYTSVVYPVVHLCSPLNWCWICNLGSKFFDSCQCYTRIVILIDLCPLLHIDADSFQKVS